MKIKREILYCNWLADGNVEVGSAGTMKVLYCIMIMIDGTEKGKYGWKLFNWVRNAVTTTFLRKETCKIRNIRY
jgi:hypothetical protein